jgi:hypothetical protein
MDFAKGQGKMGESTGKVQRMVTVHDRVQEAAL